MTDERFASRRSAVVARHGLVATSQPLAAMAGLRVLMDGGNAADAAVTVAAMLNVVEPMSTGIGGDCFALFYESSSERVSALNGSGQAPREFTLAEAQRLGLDEIPLTGPGVEGYGDVELKSGFHYRDDEPAAWFQFFRWQLEQQLVVYLQEEGGLQGTV